MEKQHFHRVWHYVRQLHPWYFLVLALIFGTVSVVALRHNNEQMVVHRKAVYVADKAGDTAALEASLRTLRQYVYGHMNTSLTSGSNAVYPPIQLQYTYERAQATQQQQLGQNNAGLYHEAQQSCEAQHPGESGAAAIACIEQYTATRGIVLGNIPDALYKFDFVSAKWSPDLAGWSLVITAGSFVTFIALSLRRWWPKRSV